MTLDEREVPTEQGPGRLWLRSVRRPQAQVLLTHGAGRGVVTHDLQALADILPRQGISVALFDMPWVVAGKRVAPAPKILDEGLRAAVAALDPQAPWVIGGRSAGARAAARCAGEVGADGVLALAFPLHPPGKPEKSRVAELDGIATAAGVGLPTLIVQGERDSMGRPEEFPEHLEMTIVPAADHGLRVPKSGPLDAAGVAELIGESVLEWLVREVIGSGEE